MSTVPDAARRSARAATDCTLSQLCAAASRALTWGGSFCLVHRPDRLADVMEELRRVRLDILDTPVSPELLPAKDGEISQKTEDLVGPYELHDFYLYYVLRFGFGPSKIFRLAKAAFAGRAEYPDEVLYKWLRNFYWRFFAQQFKRSCLPDGPKVGSVTLSPRGDWRMPSDACATLWLAELEQLKPGEQ